MRRILWCLIAAIPLLSSCGDGGGGGGGVTITKGTTYVDSYNGDNVNGDGSFEHPYKTITHALKSKDLESRIYLLSGVYDENTGEEFPIVVPEGINIESIPIDLANNRYALVRGSGEFVSDFINGIQRAAIVLRDAGGLHNLVIESIDGVAVWEEDTVSHSAIIKCLIQNSNAGVVLANNSVVHISGTTIKDNQNSGIEMLQNSSPLLTDNKIFNNDVGIVIQDNSTPNFGNSTGGGNNEIYSNVLCDLLHKGTANINIVGTKWDDDVFEFSIVNACIESANIVNEGIGTIDYQFIPPVNLPAFTATRRIILNKPDYGELLFTSEPDLSWSGVGSDTSMVAIFDEPPIVNSTGIVNTSDIIWLWHSGLSTGIAGFVSFSDGISLENSDINKPISLAPLGVGRSYYWAVWEWDDSARRIVASSDISYFRISN